MSAAAVGTVRHWMTRNPVIVEPTTPIAEVARRMAAEGIRHVLVMDGARLAGIASNRDVRGLVLAGAPALSPRSAVESVMIEDPVIVSPEAPLTEAARAMLERKIGALPVVEDGRPIGILTKSDALEALLACVEQVPRRP